MKAREWDMKQILVTLGVLAASAGAALAGGIDRSGQGISPLFEAGGYAELSFGYVRPSLSGNDVAAFGGSAIGNVASSFMVPSFAFKQDINKQLSYAVIYDQAFGANVLYPTSSVALGGTSAKTTANDLTALLRYKMNDRFSIYGGVRVQQASGNVGLSGLAYGGVNGYTVSLATDTALGYVVGAAYEIPEYAMRFALTYNSAISHKFDTVETLGGGVIGNTPTTVKTPQSVNLDLQSGINKTTLVFGSIRWANWSEFQIDPSTFTHLTGGGLVNLSNTVTYTLGVGHKFTDSWSGAASIQYEAPGNRLVSPLAPSTGLFGVTLAAVYTQGNMKITTGINYTTLGKANPQTANTARANFSGNSAVGIGVKVGWSF